MATYTQNFNGPIDSIIGNRMMIFSSFQLIDGKLYTKNGEPAHFENIETGEIIELGSRQSFTLNTNPNGDISLKIDGNLHHVIIVPDKEQAIHSNIKPDNVQSPNNHYSGYNGTIINNGTIEIISGKEATIACEEAQKQAARAREEAQKQAADARRQAAEAFEQINSSSTFVCTDSESTTAYIPPLKMQVFYTGYKATSKPNNISIFEEIIRVISSLIKDKDKDRKDYEK